jgi:hypothetical protein
MKMIKKMLNVSFDIFSGKLFLIKRHGAKFDLFLSSTSPGAVFSVMSDPSMNEL